MREIIKEALKNLEFVSGLKQMREYTEDKEYGLENLSRLINCLLDHAKSNQWMTEERLRLILKTGMEGGYGEFYHLNVKTLATWCSQYKKNNAGKLQQEVLVEEESSEVSEEEKQYWIEIGKQTFRSQWEISKNGTVPQLSLWGPYFFDKFVDKGFLKEDDYQVSVNEIKKELRLTRAYADINTILAIKKDRVWKLFIKDMIKKKIDLTKHL